MAKARRAKSKHAAEKPRRSERINNERVNDERPRKRGGSIIGKFMLIMLLLIVIAGAVLFIWYNMSLKGTGLASEKVTFEIPLGSGTNAIANILKEKDVIKSKEAFKIYVKLNNVSKFQAGTYTVTKDMTVEEITKALQTGIVFRDTDFSITFVEGKTMIDIAETIANYTNNKEQDVYDLLKNREYINSLISEYWFITDDVKNTDIYYPLEGYLFPDTYSFSTADVTVKEIFKVMLDKMDKVLSGYKTEIQTSGHTVHEILSMASIIEKEAIHDADRKGVSSVMYNRLNVNMSLGSDVTTYYAFRIKLGERDLYKSEINTYNAYNTRGPNMEGKLPVGPISSVGKASIEAAIKPSNTDYLFFVADKNGKVHFTKTNEEHQEKINDLKINDLWYTYPEN